MRWLKIFLILVLCIAICFVGIMFAINNTAKVSIDLVFVTLPEANLSLWLIGFLVIGGFLGFILSGLVIIALKARLMSSRRKIKAMTKEIGKLQASSTALEQTT